MDMDMDILGDFSHKIGHSSNSLIVAVVVGLGRAVAQVALLIIRVVHLLGLVVVARDVVARSLEAPADRVDDGLGLRAKVDLVVRVARDRGGLIISAIQANRRAMDLCTYYVAHARERRAPPESMTTLAPHVARMSHDIAAHAKT